MIRERPNHDSPYTKEVVMGEVLVLGATGLVGSMVATRLAALGVPVRAASREPERARAALPGVAAVALDLERPATFAPALAGIQRVFLIARPGDEAPDVVAAPLIAAMREAGVERVVDLTALGIERAAHAPGLRRAELLLEASGLAFTHLRPSFFMQLFSAGTLADGLRERGVLAVPAGDARIAFIDASDVADVAVRALTEPGHAGRAYELTGPDALDHAEVARLVGLAAERALRYVALDEAQAAAALGAAGFPPSRVERLLRFYRVVRSGAAATVSPDVERVLGRAPTAFRDFARRHASAWRAPAPRAPAASA
ncbi:MAG: NAD(P)H-binding protein [Myxococcota bacterium]